MGAEQGPQGGDLGRASLAKAGFLRVLVIEGNPFLQTLLRDSLTMRGITVVSAASIAEGITAIGAKDPHCVVVDLDVDCYQQGAELFAHCSRATPWVGLVALESSTRQQGKRVFCPPPHAVRLTKAKVVDVEQIVAAIDRAICCEDLPHQEVVDAGTTWILTPEQAEVLQLIARGWTNDAIARHRGTSLRAAENIVQRTFRSLGLQKASNGNLRVEATNLWHAGTVVVKASRQDHFASG